MSRYKPSLHKRAILLTPDQVDLLNDLGTSIAQLPDGRKFYYMPYWFTWNRREKCITLYSLGKLPKDLMEVIRGMRNLPDSKTK